MWKLAQLPRHPASDAVLVAAVKDGSPEVRSAAISTLGEAEEEVPGAVAALTDGLVDEDPRIRAAAAEALRGLAPWAGAALPALRALAGDRPPADHIFGAVSRLSGTAVVPLLDDALRDGRAEVKQAVAECLAALAEAATEADRPALEASARDRRKAVRTAAGSALARLSEQGGLSSGAAVPPQ